jgi:hypothetical protein
VDPRQARDIDANGNACGDRTVTAFLVSGRRPARDVHCQR